MLIKVLYNEGKLLFCNTDCLIANLLEFIRKQTGNLDCDVVDLADENGRVLELDEHRLERASKRLAQKGDQFILVEKKQRDPNEEDFDTTVLYQYSALLDNWASRYPNIKAFYTTSMGDKKRGKEEQPAPSSGKTSKRAGKETPGSGKALLKPGELRPTSSGISKASSANVAAKGKKKQT